ncbi:RagB/SusD family nutrient uptake outer membrane protein [Flammeovirga pectinis]|uniref:RagB/SusD family nutrient uptake outer membrane protein n=1 Tax=Flammeovirga pectinis TaxID=2494373 RepID=A0A3Q9FNZ0_9BACT|nr:RagB/SusD family nutrient uptake outer membrane protein [Flammeovirga pectinis]AZQ61477.1 RagB/SusD family nutrient uptake outer membrane protein [Flammeovirga pectinis]
MKTLLKNIGLLVTFIILGTSCQKEWLVIDQPGAQPVEDFYKTDEQAEQALVAAYAQLQRQYASTGYVSPRLLKAIPSDMINAGGGDVGDQAWLQQINLYINTQSTPNVWDVWRAYYFTIYRANLIIEKVEPVGAKAAIVGEAMALRAYMYFELTNMFKDVPLVLKEQSTEEYYVEKSTQAEIYTQIEKDLLAAIDLIPETQPAKWRMGKGFAQTILAKTYMFQNKEYAAAFNLLDKVIKSGEYSLEQKFDDVLHVPGEWGKESLWEIGFRSNNPYGNGFPWNPDDAESSINMVLCGPRDFAGAHTINRGGWGFQNPTEWIYKKFDANDPRRDQSLISWDDFKAKYYEPGGVYETYIADQPADYKPETSDSVKWSGWEAKRWQIEGYLRMKYDARTTERAEPEWEYSAGTNERILRYAEVLLLAAEAKVQLGEGGAAAGYINEVRQRSGYTTLVSNVTMDDIEYERMAELAFEGHRWFDLRRWGKLDATLSSFSDFENQKVKDGELNSDVRTFDAKNAYFPIPIEELSSNPNLKQNEGW